MNFYQKMKVKNRYVGFRSLFNILITILIILFIYFYSKDSFHLLKNIGNKINYQLIIPIVLTIILCNIIAGILWAKLAIMLGSSLSTSLHLSVYFYTLAVRRLPGVVMQIFARGIVYSDLNIKARWTVLTSSLEFALIIWSGAIISLVSVMISSGFTNKKILMVLPIIVIILSAIIHQRPIKWIYEKLFNEKILISVPNHKIYLLLLGYISLWLVGSFILYFIILSFEPITLHDFPQILSAWSIGGISGMLAMILPTGLGITELTITILLNKILPGSLAILAALVARILQTTIDCLFSFTGWLWRSTINPKELL